MYYGGSKLKNSEITPDICLMATYLALEFEKLSKLGDFNKQLDIFLINITSQLLKIISVYPFCQAKLASSSVVVLQLKILANLGPRTKMFFWKCNHLCKGLCKEVKLHF